MSESTNRASRRSSTLRRAGTSVVAGAAAAALTVGLAPSAEAAIPVNINLDPVYTAGTIASLLNRVGNAFPDRTLGGLYHTGPPQSVGTSVWFPYGLTVEIPNTGGRTATISINLDITANLFLNNIQRPTTKTLYNTLAAMPQQNTGCGGYTLDPKNNKVVESNPASTCRFSVMMGTSGATRLLANAYSTEIASVQDPISTPDGYIPMQGSAWPPDGAPTAAKPMETNQLLAFLQNPLRPNGGLLSRFPSVSKLIGQDPDMPAAGLYKSADGSVTLNTTTLDATWAYDPKADFPEVFNVFSIINSLNAILPINLTGGLSTTQPYVLANSTGGIPPIADVGANLVGLFQIGVGPVPVPNVLEYGKLNPFYLQMAPGQALYATVVPKQLPFYTPFRLPSLAINAALGALGAGFRIGTPIINALEPATKILVNIGYDDVITPDKLYYADPNSTANPKLTYAEEGYQAYDRTFLKAGISTPFGSVDPLTKEERKQVPKDVFAALGAGFKQMLTTPGLGFIVPAPASSAASTAPSSAVAARVAAPAAATAAPAVKAVASRTASPAASTATSDNNDVAKPGGRQRPSR